MVSSFLWHIMSFELLLQFGIKSAVLNAELPQNSRLHILEVCYLSVVTSFYSESS